MLHTTVLSWTFRPCGFSQRLGIAVAGAQTTGVPGLSWVDGIMLRSVVSTRTLEVGTHSQLFHFTPKIDENWGNDANLTCIFRMGLARPPPSVGAKKILPGKPSGELWIRVRFGEV